MYHGQPGFIRYVPWNLPLKLSGFTVHEFADNTEKHSNLFLFVNLICEKIKFNPFEIDCIGLFMRIKLLRTAVVAIVSQYLVASCNDCVEGEGFEGIRVSTLLTLYIFTSVSLQHRKTTHT